MTRQRFPIRQLGLRGEGVAETPTGPLYIPYALPGEAVLVEPDADVLAPEIIEMRADRLAPICPYFGVCGGCAVQTLPRAEYAAWKHRLVAEALRKAGVAAEVAPLVAAHGAGRRRATFHARAEPSPNVLRAPHLRVGFMRARTHEVIDLAACPLFAPELGDALPAARHIARTLQGLGKPLDLVVTTSDAGLDIDLRGLGPLAGGDRRRLVEVADTLDLARLSNHGELLVERRPPILRMGLAALHVPPGAFLQATVAGETEMAALVAEAVGPARRVADLFCGVGTFALRLAEHATVTGIDIEGPSLAALRRAGRSEPKLRPLETEARDLFRRPLVAGDLQPFEAVVFDPPRAGASAQSEALAVSGVPTVVAVSCNPSTFARDAAILLGGGYLIEQVVPIDQFLFSPHVEIVAVFRRPKSKVRNARRLFG